MSIPVIANWGRHLKSFLRWNHPSSLFLQLLLLLSVVLAIGWVSIRYWNHLMMEHLMQKAMNPADVNTAGNSMIMLGMNDLYHYVHTLEFGFSIALSFIVLLLLSISGRWFYNIRNRQRHFTTHVSHELRTPLTIVYGYLQSLLRRSPNLTLDQREALEIATAETQHTIEILQRLLDDLRGQSSHSSLR